MINRTIKYIEFKLPRPYFAAGHYNVKIRASIHTWAKNHNITIDDYTVTATGDYKLHLQFKDDRHYTLWALSWDNATLPDWLIIK